MEGQQLATELGVPYQEISSKTGRNIVIFLSLFHQLCLFSKFPYTGENVMACFEGSVREVCKKQLMKNTNTGSLQNVLGSQYQGGLIDVEEVAKETKKKNKKGKVIIAKPSGYGTIQYSVEEDGLFREYRGGWKEGKRDGYGVLILRSPERDEDISPIECLCSDGRVVKLLEGRS